METCLLSRLQEMIAWQVAYSVDCKKFPPKNSSTQENIVLLHQNFDKMLRIHKEGRCIILVAFLIFAAIVAASLLTSLNLYVQITTILPVSVLFFLVVWFFRNPERKVLKPDPKQILAPADGKIVIIEEVEEGEYFKDKRMQVSIFMSPLNVHVNRYPTSGVVTYYKYHPGKYLVAWHPKSSLLNERSTIVLKAENGQEILLRQIAGAVARRIVTYSREGDKAVQGEDLGFIKFGSRVDIFLPLDAKINVQLNQKSVGNQTVIATLS